MDIGVLAVPLDRFSLEEACEYLADRGVGAVELGTGGYPGTDHLSPADLLDDEDRQASVRSTVEDHGLYVSALATHDNPLHPDAARAESADEDLRRSIRLAGQLGVDAVTCFSGLPGGSPEDVTPNWITAPWPPEHAEALDYQWEVAIDYWTDIADLAAECGVDVAVEMHPNMLVHEPHGLVRLREATGERIGANFDPSHLYWQGIDVPAAIRYLGERDAIHHVHAKDTAIYDDVVRTKGVLDGVSYEDSPARSWQFRAVGYGHGESHWRSVVSALRMVGYDGALSIEHEDNLVSPGEGLERGIEMLQRIVLRTEGSAEFSVEP